MGLYNLAKEAAPSSVRHLFYRAVGAGLIEKTEAEYHGTIIRLLTDLRRDGSIPYDWITDGTRFVNAVSTYGSPAEALEEMAALYRRNLFDDGDVRIEVWTEKSAIAGILMPITHKYTVPLVPLRGYPSETFLFNLATEIRQDGRETFIYYFGDHDPSGRDIERHVKQRIADVAEGAVVNFKRLAVTEEQINEYKLPTRPTKKTDTRAKGFIGESVEVDAMDPRDLECILELAITYHLDEDEVGRLRLIEKQECETFAAFARKLKKATT